LPAPAGTCQLHGAHPSGGREPGQRGGELGHIDAAGCVDLGEGAEPEEPEWIAPQLLVAAGPLAAGVVTALSLPQGGPSGARAAGGRCPARCCTLASHARSVIGPARGPARSG
jgi:hypothetical protein